MFTALLQIIQIICIFVKKLYTYAKYIYTELMRTLNYKIKLYIHIIRLLETLASSIINPERAVRRAPRLRVYDQDIEDEERGLPTVSAVQIPLHNAFRLNARSDMLENPMYESTPVDSASLRRAHSYGGSPYSQLDIQTSLNRKRHATAESEGLYQHPKSEDQLAHPNYQFRLKKRSQLMRRHIPKQRSRKTSNENRS